MKESSDTRWYAIYTKSRAEKKTAGELAKKGFEVYLPLQKTLKQWSDRKKIVELPLITSYLFVRINLCSYFTVLNTNGVVKFINFSSKPVPIPDWQIDNLKILMNSDEKLEISTEDFKIGDHVFVERGTLGGLRGILVEHRAKQKVLIRIDSIEKNILVNIHQACLKKEQIDKAI